MWNEKKCQKCQMSWNALYQIVQMSNVMKYPMLWNVKCHEMTNVMKFQMSISFIKFQISNVKCHEMSDVMKCQM